ncbi:hypothetical protein CMK14_16720 [Candidatus Poribacteria bacterium]|nr:hypothetical protein [Candidatus Poribacteria bacterium]
MLRAKKYYSCFNHLFKIISWPGQDCDQLSHFWVAFLCLRPLWILLFYHLEKYPFSATPSLSLTI